VPTATFKLLYCFFVIEHSLRKILHFNVTRYPTAEWVVQQVRDAFHEARRTATSFWIAMRNSIVLSCNFLRRQVWNPNGRASGVPGKTEWRSVA
jgi:hypothetical protein